MEFLDMVMKLQMIYDKKIILISCGVFYIAVASDAILLHRKLGLKINCAKKNICKIGVPRNSIYKYIKSIEELGYSYIVLEYDKTKNELKKKYEKDGKDKETYLFNDNCNDCNNKKNLEITEYEKALNKYLKEEFGRESIW